MNTGGVLMEEANWHRHYVLVSYLLTLNKKR